MIFILHSIDWVFLCILVDFYLQQHFDFLSFQYLTQILIKLTTARQQKKNFMFTMEHKNRKNQLVFFRTTKKKQEKIFFSYFLCNKLRRVQFLCWCSLKCLLICVKWPRINFIAHVSRLKREILWRFYEDVAWKIFG